MDLLMDILTHFNNNKKFCPYLVAFYALFFAVSQ
jgi:hypothetical protein